MMRILLINPYYPISETPSPPLGLATVNWHAARIWNSPAGCWITAWMSTRRDLKRDMPPP